MFGVPSSYAPWDSFQICTSVCWYGIMQNVSKCLLLLHCWLFTFSLFGSFLFIIFIASTSVLWCCWLGGRKGIQPVKIWSDEVLAWLSVWSEVQTICIWFSLCHCHPVISCFSKIQNGLSFWYRPTHVVLEKKAIQQLCVCVLSLFIIEDKCHGLFVGRMPFQPTSIVNTLKENTTSCHIYLLLWV